MIINRVIFFISLQLFFLSAVFAEPNDIKTDCKLTCKQIVKSITTKQYRGAHKKFIAIVLRDHEKISGSSEYDNTYLFDSDSLDLNDEQRSCQFKTLSHCIMVEEFENIYQQQADTLSKALVKSWNATGHSDLEGLMLYLDTAVESINILQSPKTYKAPNNILDLSDNNQITHFIIRRMLKKLDPDLVNKYLSSMKDLKHRVSIQYKKKHSQNTRKVIQSYNSIEAFVEEIVKTANEHDYQGIVKLLDEEFYEEQLNEIHEGDETTFSNEFFCGDFKEKYKCIVFKNIKSIIKKSHRCS